MSGSKDTGLPLVQSNMWWCGVISGMCRKLSETVQWWLGQLCNARCDNNKL